jgi:hypothetical protein
MIDYLDYEAKIKEHLDYEKTMLLQLYYWLNQPQPLGTTQAQLNCLVESFCVHAACLLDYSNIRHPDHILFWREKINEQIFTLTHKRTSKSEEKVTGPEPRMELFNYLSAIYGIAMEI